MAKSKRQREEREKRKKISAKKYTETSGKSQTGLKLPDGVKQFKFLKAGRYYIDIIPFTASSKNPDVNEGEPYFVRTYYVHKGFSEDYKSIVCLRKTFDKPCPLCNFRTKLIAKNPEQVRSERGAPQTLAEKLYPKTRQLWNVWDRQDKESGVQVFEAAYNKSFGEKIAAYVSASCEEAEAEGKESEDEFFADPIDGKTIVVTTTEDTYDGRKFFQPTSITMKDRESPVPTSVLKKAPSLDEILEMNTMSAKDMEAYVNGTLSSTTAIATDDDEDEDDEFDEDEFENDEDEMDVSSILEFHTRTLK